MSKPSAILFDWDNTLVDSFPAIHAAFNATLESMGQAAWPVQEARERIGPPANVIFPQLFGEDRWEEARDIYYDNFLSNYKCAEILPGARALLEYIASHDIYMGVISAKRGDPLRKEAAHLELDHFFGKMVGTGDLDVVKPDPLMIEEALKGTNLKPDNTLWYAGDHLTDMEMAHRAGCTGILVNGTDIQDKIPPEHKPAHVFQNCEAFAVFLKNTF